MNVDDLLSFLEREPTQSLVLLTDSIVDAYYPNYLERIVEEYPCQKIVMPAGEQSKTMEQATAIWRQLLERQYDKTLTIINFGGGMICDLGGFVAATFKRGVRCINYPTTLLAMVDAAIGGKTAVNLDYVKNAVGLVRQPSFVVHADTPLLDTLPYPELLSGFGEMVKYAIIASPELFEQLEQLETLTARAIRPEWIETCVRYKERVVAIDPDDQCERQILNLGHTYGHAVESFFAHSGTPIPHGVAVVYGLAYECDILLAEGLLQNSEYQRIISLINKFYEVPPLTEAWLEELKPYIAQDKKSFNGRVRIPWKGM